MKIFLTGATGFIGRYVTQALLDAGHHVSALVRREEDAADLRLKGVVSVRGDLQSSLELIGQQASNADAVVRISSSLDVLCSTHT